MIWPVERKIQLLVFHNKYTEHSINGEQFNRALHGEEGWNTGK